MTTTNLPITEQASDAEAAPPQPDTPTAERPQAPDQPRPAVPLPHSPVRVRRTMGRYDGPTNVDEMLRLATALAKASTTVPYQFRNPGDMLSLMQRARALDVSLAAAWDNLVFNPDGVGGMRARLMHALVLRAGHDIIPVHVDDKKVRMLLKRCDGRPSGGASWTILEAQRNRLLDKDRSPWHGYPQDMLWARCLSRVTRRYAPDVTLGLYVPEDLDDIPTDEIDPADMSMAMTDADGNPVVAPDVEELLKDLDILPFADIRERYQIAHEEGLLGAYAGTIDGIHYTVGELLYEKGTEAHQREQAMSANERAKLNPFPTSRPGTRPAADGDPDAPQNLDDLAVEDLPAGTGDRLPCGCTVAGVLASGGKHEEGCTR